MYLTVYYCSVLYWAYECMSVLNNILLYCTVSTVCVLYIWYRDSIYCVYPVLQRITVLHCVYCLYTGHITCTIKFIVHYCKTQERKSNRSSKEIEQRKESQKVHTHTNKTRTCDPNYRTTIYCINIKSPSNLKGLEKNILKSNLIKNLLKHWLALSA